MVYFKNGVYVHVYVCALSRAERVKEGEGIQPFYLAAAGQ